MNEVRSVFLRITCPKCRHPHVIFSKASIEVKCRKCNYLLSKSSGGKTKIRAPVQEVVWN